MAGSNIKIVVPNSDGTLHHDELDHREYPMQHPLESIYRQEDNKSLPEVLSEKAKKTIVFVMPGEVTSGLQNPVVRFPFPGTITKCFAFCTKSSSILTYIRVERISEENFMQDGQWESIFSEDLQIPPGAKFSTKSTVPYIINNPIVQANDYFRIYIGGASGMRDLTVHVEIQI